MGNSIGKVKDSVVTAASNATSSIASSVKGIFSESDDHIDDFENDPTQQRFIPSAVFITLPFPMARFKDQVTFVNNNHIIL